MVEIQNSTSLNAEKIMVRQANDQDVHYAVTITDEMESSAKARGTGIAKRSPDYVAQKMREGKAVIAHLSDGTWVGFCYIEAWGHGKFVANSGLIVAPEFRKTGVATQIKRQIFNLSRSKYPDSKIFGLTTGLAVMKMNSEIGYTPVTYSELTDDEEFWAGCKSCINYEILQLKERKNCLCTAMLYDPAKKEAREPLTLQATYAEKSIPIAPSVAAAQIAAQANTLRSTIAPESFKRSSHSVPPASAVDEAVEAVVGSTSAPALPKNNFDRFLGTLREKLAKLKGQPIL